MSAEAKISKKERKAKPSRPIEGEENDQNEAIPHETAGESSTASPPLPTNEPVTSKKRRRATEAEEEELEVDLSLPKPLSKAEARAARKKIKGKIDTATDSAPQPAEEKKEEKPSKPKKINSIWIGNLAFKTTSDSLKGFLLKGLENAGFESGEGVITRVNLPKQAGKQKEMAGNKGFAYVDFASEELQQAAVRLSEGMLEGRRVLIKLGDDHNPTADARTPKPYAAPKTGNPVLRKQPNPPSTTLFVGNLPFDATEEALREAVEMQGMNEQGDGAEVKVGLRKVRLGAFEDTGRCKGFAFLDFETVDQATAALLERNNHFYGGRNLILQYAGEDATRRSGGSKRKTEGDVPIQARRPGKAERNGNGPTPSDRPKRVQPTADASTDMDIATAVVDVIPEMVEEVPRKRTKTSSDQRGKKWEAAGRPRPGAALAMAKREKVGIVEATGTKVTFD